MSLYIGDQFYQIDKLNLFSWTHAMKIENVRKEIGHFDTLENSIFKA